jgi:hypothetical protein
MTDRQDLIQLLHAVLEEARGIEEDAREDWKRSKIDEAHGIHTGPVAAEVLDLCIAYRERLEGMITPVLEEKGEN